MKKLIYYTLIIFTCLIILGCSKKNINNIDSDRWEFKVKTGETVVFYFEKDKVSAYEEYFEYKDEDEAKLSLSITESELNDPNVINIFRKKNYIVLGYSDKYINDQFGKYNKEDIIEMYSAYEKNN